MSEDIDLAEIWAIIEANDARKAHPWAFDLIEVLWPHPAGLKTRDVYPLIKKRRDEVKLSTPDTFEESVRSIFNARNVDGTAFRKGKVKPIDAIFYTRGRGVWCVNREKALAWVASKPGLQKV